MSCLPADVREFLDAVHALNLDANRRNLDQLTYVIGLLNEIGVQPVLLKGAAALVSGLYPALGTRMIGDIDILIPPAKLTEAVKQLRSAGYQPADTENELPGTENFELHRHDYPHLRREDWPAPLELHVRPVNPKAARLFGSEELVGDAVPLNWRGVECMLPSPTHFVLHNVIHAFVMDIRDRGVLSLRQLFEFVLASRIYAERINWAAIQDRFDSTGHGNDLRGYVVLANAYLGFQAPPILGLNEWEWTRFYQIQLENPAMHFLVFAGRRLRTRARHIVINPRVLTGLLSARFYMRLYQETMAAYQSIR
jgi:Uncharacterised nucleotidyltransferase